MPAMVIVTAVAIRIEEWMRKDFFDTLRKDRTMCGLFCLCRQKSAAALAAAQENYFFGGFSGTVRASSFPFSTVTMP